MGEKAITRLLKVAVCGWFFGSSILLPGVAAAATQYFSPSAGGYSAGSTFEVSVYATSADQAANAFAGSISFPPNLLNVVEINQQSSIVKMWVQGPSYSNTSGTITFEGFVPNPGYQGSGDRLMTITFAVKDQGIATLEYARGAVLANDGYGTDITEGLGGATFALGIAQHDNPEVAGFSTATEDSGSALDAEDTAPANERGSSELNPSNSDLTRSLSSDFVALASPMWARNPDQVNYFGPAVDSLSLFMNVLILLVCLLFIVLAVALTIVLIARHTHHHTRRALGLVSSPQSRKLYRALRGLRHDLHKQLRHLERARFDRSLTEAEQRMLTKTSRALTQLEDDLARSLDNV